MTNKLSLWIFSLIAVAGAGAGWFSIFSALKNQPFDWPTVLVCFLIFLIAIFWVTFLSFRYSLVVFALSTCPVVAISFSLASFLSFALAFLIFAIGAKKIKKHLKNSVKIKISATLLVSYSLVTTALFISATGLYFSELTKNKSHGRLPSPKIALSQKTTDLILKKTGPFFGLNLMALDPTLSLMEAVRNSLQKELEREPSDAEIKQYIAALEKSWQMEVDPQESIAQVFNQLINQKIADYIDALKRASPLSTFSLALGLFLTLKTIAFLFEWPFFLIMEIIFWIGKTTGFLKLNRRDVTKETLA